MVYEYQCGGCSKYGGVGDCTAIGDCIKDKEETESEEDYE